jgi:hypothetical protein
MPELGKVTVFQPNRTTVVSSNYRPQPNISLSDINNISTEGVQDGYSLVFNSANNRFEMNIATLSLANTTLSGGTF